MRNAKPKRKSKGTSNGQACENNYASVPSAGDMSSTPASTSACTASPFHEAACSSTATARPNSADNGSHGLNTFTVVLSAMLK